MDDFSSNQLQRDLRTSIVRALASHRPILTHLNADTSWLLSLAWPLNKSERTASAQRARRRGQHHHQSHQHRFNILIDPWLKGPQSDVAGWFSTQWHEIESSVQTIEELERHLEEIEKMAAEAEEEEETAKKHSRRSKAMSDEAPNGSSLINDAHSQDLGPRGFENTASHSESSHISAVFVSHEFTDHCHRATLLELTHSTPVYAVATAVPLIESWKHFDSVYTVPAFDPSAPWPDKSMGSLPSWLRVVRVTTESNALYYHSALAVLFKGQGPSSRPSASAISRLNSKKEAETEDAEAIIYTPHGVSADSLAPLFNPLQSPQSLPSPPPSPPYPAKTQIQPLALLHGLHSVRLRPTSQLNLGLPNAQTVQEAFRPRYWVGTHDEVKKASGVVSWLLSRKDWKVGDLVGMGKEERKESREQEEGARYVELGSGDGLLLE